MERNQMYNALLILFNLIFCYGYELHGSWIPLAPSLGASSRRIELGENGRRMAVGTFDKSIIIYDLVVRPSDSNVEALVWEFAGQLNGVDGVNFSLSSDGRFLASRHASSAKQVQVWEILSNRSHTASVAMNEKSADFVFLNVGTFWCVADGQSVKLFKAKSKLVLAMSCETWLSNRGKVQVFVRDFSSLNIHDSEWNEFMTHLKGRNADDRFGSALSIADGYLEYDFQLAIGCPGYNRNQGLVLVYGVSLATSTGWKQIGNDLTGSNEGERFGSSLDMSANTQPYLLIGSPGWKVTKDVEGTSADDDVISEQESFESLGCGIVRLFHWRKSGSSIRSTRRWVLVGDPMTGRNKADRFGTHVAISHTGERIAIATSRMKTTSNDECGGVPQAGYIGVYERQSWNSWGQPVNSTIPIREVHSDDMLPIFALNDHGSMVATVISKNSIKVFLDGSPFCGFPVSETLGSADSGAIDPEVSDLNIWLGRQICRENDSLVVNESACSEQQVFRGNYKSCSWRDIPIFHFPAQVQLSTSPSPLSAIAPSLSPSFNPDVISSEAPSLQQNRSISSVSPSTASTFASAKPSSRNSIKSSSHPSRLNIRNDGDGSSVLPSALPTGKTQGKPHEIPTGLPFSYHPTREISVSPTDISTNERHDESPVVVVCHCNIFNTCFDRTISEDSPKLRICVSVASIMDAKVVSLNSAKLRQEDFSISVVDGAEAINEDGATKMNCSAMSKCYMETPVSSVFFGTNRPSSVVVEGNVSVEESHPVSRNALINRVSFSITIALNQINTTPTSSPKETDEKDNGMEHTLIGGATASFVLLLIVLVFCGWFCKKYSCRQKNHPNSVNEALFDI